MKLYKHMLTRLRENAKGFTLVEVLAGIVIVSIVGTALLAYFSNAYMYTKANQNKTVAVNLARYSLVYFEQQDFDIVKTWLTEVDETIDISDFDRDFVDPRLRSLFPIIDSNDPTTDTARLMLAPEVNGVTYNVEISLDRDRYDAMLTDTERSDLKDWLLPIKVVVVDPSKPNRNHSEVEGYITHEDIR